MAYKIDQNLGYCGFLLHERGLVKRAGICSFLDRDSSSMDPQIWFFKFDTIRHKGDEKVILLCNHHRQEFMINRIADHILEPLVTKDQKKFISRNFLIILAKR